jgi:hypothetical protein
VASSSPSALIPVGEGDHSLAGIVLLAVGVLFWLVGH